MVQNIGVKFGTTDEELRAQILKLCEAYRWDKNRVHFVIDINKCTVRETVYAVSDDSGGLPLHTDGPDAVQKLIP